MKIPRNCENKKMVFFGDPGIDLQITIFLLIVSFIISLVVLALAKRKFLSVIVFSFLGNLVLLGAIFTRSEIFDFYDIKWLKYFSLFIWTLLNIFLIIHYARTNPKK